MPYEPPLNWAAMAEHSDFLQAFDSQLVHETGVQGDSLANSLVRMEDHMARENTEVRVAILASLTYLFVVWNPQCQFYASLAQIEANKGEASTLRDTGIMSRPSASVYR